MGRRKISERQVARHWNSNAERWSRQVRAGGDVYREYFNNPAMLKFIGPLDGLEVLDAGCGEGYNTRILARRAARMTGVDISARMIELAREEERRSPLGIRYELNSFSDLSSFEGQSFDRVVSFMALMDGPDFAGAMGEIRRVLRPGGELCFSILHPCFHTKGFGWVTDETGREKFTVADYFNDDPWVERWGMSHSPKPEPVPFAVPRFDRTLSYYLNTLIASGLALKEILEPRPSARAVADHPFLSPWRNQAAFFFYVRAAKPRRVAAGR